MALLVAAVLTLGAGATAAASRTAGWPGGDADRAGAEAVGTAESGARTAGTAPTARLSGGRAGHARTRADGPHDRGTGAGRVGGPEGRPGWHVAVLQPDVLAVAAAPIRPAALADLRHRLPGAVLTVAAAGRLSVAGHRLATVAADPAEVARFVPAVTAHSAALWERVAAGDAAVAFGADRAVRRWLGRVTPVAGGGLRIGALAAFGLPGVDAVVSRTSGERLGLAPRRVLVVSAPGHDAGRVAAAVLDTLGRRAAVDVLHTDRPSRPQPVRSAADPPRTWRDLYQRAATTCPGLPWRVLAAIGTIESGNGRDTSTSSAGAMGPMQFLPSTWAAYGVDADRDGRADIADPVDAVYSAARYLCDNGASRGGQALAGAVYAYNHADWYVADVLSLARRIG